MDRSYGGGGQGPSRVSGCLEASPRIGRRTGTEAIVTGGTKACENEASRGDGGPG